MAAPAWASLGSLLPSRLSPTPPVTWEVWGSAMNPVDPLASPPGVEFPCPGLRGSFCPLPRGLRVPGACAAFSLRLPGVARGPWLHASPRPVGCPRGGNLGWLRWGGPCHWAAVADSVGNSAIRSRAQGSPPCCPSLRRDRAAAPSASAGCFRSCVVGAGSILSPEVSLLAGAPTTTTPII